MANKLWLNYGYPTENEVEIVGGFNRTSLLITLRYVNKHSSHVSEACLPRDGDFTCDAGIESLWQALITFRWRSWFYRTLITKLS